MECDLLLKENWFTSHLLSHFASDLSQFLMVFVCFVFFIFVLNLEPPRKRHRLPEGENRAINWASLKKRRLSEITVSFVGTNETLKWKYALAPFEVFVEIFLYAYLNPRGWGFWAKCWSCNALLFIGLPSAQHTDLILFIGIPVIVRVSITKEMP